MRRFILTILFLFICSTAFAQTYLWRYQTHATDCTGLTGGKTRDLCYEQDAQTLYKCVPSAGDCDTAGEWKLISDVDTFTISSSDTLTNKTIDTASNTITVVEADISDLSHTTDTNLTQEEVEDFAGALVGDGTGTHTGIAVTYQDATGDVDMVIDHDAASNFVANEHLDWTSSSVGTIHATNYVDNDTTYAGVEDLETPTDDSVIVGTGTVYESKVLTDCDGATNAVTYDVTTNAFGCNTIAGGSGDSVSVDSVSVTDPDFVSTGDIDFVDTTNTITANINAGSIIETDLDGDNAPVDEDFLQYDSTGTNFVWRSDVEVISDLSSAAADWDSTGEVTDDSHNHTTTTLSSIADADMTADTLTHASIADADQATTKCIYFEDPVATDDFNSIWANKTANDFLLTEIWAESDQTVTFMLQVDDGTPADVDTVDLAPAIGEAEDTSLNGDTTVAAGEELDLAITSVANTPTWVSICWTGNWVD